MSRAKGGYCVPRRPATPIVPEVSRVESSAQLAGLGTVEFEFNVDTKPIIDMFVRSDVALTAQVFIRTSPTDTYAQLGGDFGAIPAAELHPAGSHLINALRVPGTQCKIRLTNPTAGATTVCVVQVHARSL